MTEGQPELGPLAWPAVSARLGRGPLWLAVPLGSTEQHGPHLPLTTDTDIAVHLALGLAHRRRDVAVGPALAYGASGEHAGFAGTLSVGTAVLELVLVEITRSADAFAGIIVVNGHGGNGDALAGAERIANADGRKFLAWSPALPGADAHAGRTETSIMLALRPDAVVVDEARAGEIIPLARLLPRLRAQGVRAVSANGVLGDPAGASAEEGRVLLDTMLDDLTDRVDAWIRTA